MRAFAILFLSVLCCLAGGLRLAWDPSDTPDVVYVVYAATNGASFTNWAIRLPVGTNLTVGITDVPSGRWQFMVTAMLAGVESDPSNILLVDVPAAPTSLRTVFLQYSTNLTNWSDVGFFKVRIQ